MINTKFVAHYLKMEIKKTPNASLENKRPFFLLIGFISAICFFFIIINIKINSHSNNYDPYSKPLSSMEDDYISEYIFESPSNNMPHIAPKSIETIEPTPPKNTKNDDFNILEDHQELVELEQEVDKREQEAGSILEDALVEEIKKTEDYSIEETQEGDILPEFTGGLAGLNRFIYTNIIYPQKAYSNRIQGRVVYSFIVNEDGSISDLSLIKGVEESLDKESLRVLAMMPMWSPGKKSGKPIKIRYQLALYFRL
ncbi:protein TonB [Bacteroidales bacterium]|nr:protein TonB [Bacteroidales bacterium]